MTRLLVNESPGERFGLMVQRMVKCKDEQWLPPIFKLNSKEYIVDIENRQLKEFQEPERTVSFHFENYGCPMCLIRPSFFDII